MNKSILLTRAKSANLILKEKLMPRGFDLIECSLIKHKLLPLDKELFNKHSDIVITSNFAASNLPNSNGSKYVWVVGENSEKILKDKAYKIKFCAPDAITLKKELLKNNHIKAIYLSGNNITIDMPPNIKRIIFYNTDYKQSLSQPEIQRIKLG
ncbi:MAG: hypothetical protein AAF673_01275, partial [Pseudomonadota bacterium]